MSNSRLQDDLKADRLLDSGEQEAIARLMLQRVLQGRSNVTGPRLQLLKETAGRSQARSPLAGVPVDEIFERIRELFRVHALELRMTEHYEVPDYMRPETVD